MNSEEIDYKWLFEYFLSSDLTKKEFYVFGRLIYKNDVIFIDTKEQIRILIEKNRLKTKPENFYKIIKKLKFCRLVEEITIDDRKALRLIKSSTVDDISELSSP
ncbi:hypothetical protein CO725_13695 [Vibrio parahaemolyticus]|uniref:hypothetical protein n=1 Tax=Vibrio parahaemolyticus TaxID=670 RepID=UPI000BE24CA3|nr:hypothetical protein [Vibrio parahaemolyticus]ATI46685.1 hypothetical protein CO725_13695 [Vibrio parahaemolyticus]